MAPSRPLQQPATTESSQAARGRTDPAHGYIPGSSANPARRRKKTVQFVHAATPALRVCSVLV